MEAVISVGGTPTCLRFPIEAHHLWKLMGLDQPSRMERMAVMIVCTGMACCSRVSELANLHLCKLLWGHDGAFVAELAAALTIRIYKRKQDTGRFGLYVRIVAGVLTDLMWADVADLNLRTDDRCKRGSRQGTEPVLRSGVPAASERPQHGGNAACAGTT